LVDLDVLDDEIACIESFGIGVGFGIPQETKQKFCRFYGPSGTGNTELLALEHTKQLVKDMPRPNVTGSILPPLWSHKGQIEGTPR
jgi:hypothetical protein